MPPFYRLAEVSFYSILNFLPFMLIAMYPFRNHFRFSRTITYLLSALIVVIQVVLGIIAVFFSGNHSGYVSALNTILYALFFFLIVKASFGKILFTLLMMSNIANLTVSASKCLEGHIFPAYARQAYRWSCSLTTFLVEVVLLIPMFIYVKKSFTPAVEKEPSGSEWRSFWLIPATFYLLWFYGIYGNATLTSLELALRPANTIFYFFINLGACLVYHVVARLILTQSKNMELLESNHQLTLQSMQYNTLQERITEARRVKHDIRHHITVITEYLKSKSYNELEAYLKDYQRSLPDDTLLSFCENHVANSVLLYFAQQAKNNNIDYLVKAVIPRSIGVSDIDLSILLGNLLENALHACMDEISERKQISVHAETDASSFYLTVDNTFTGALKKSDDGTFLSTKHTGFGIGTESVRHIADVYHGLYQTKQQDGMFMTSVMLTQKSGKS